MTHVFRLTLLVLILLLVTAACGGGEAARAWPVDYIHTVTNENRVANATIDRSPVGVLYGAAEGASAPLGRWMIVNLDLVLEPTMPAGAAFNVSILQPGPNAFVHRVTRTSGAANDVTHLPGTGTTRLGTSDAYVFLTPRLTHLDGTTAATNRHAVATWWTGANWGILNLNGASMPLQCSYNVVLTATTGPDVFSFTTMTTRATVGSGTTVLSENAVLHVSQFRDTRGRNDRDVALRYAASRAEWGVANTEGSDVRAYAVFRALIRRP